MKQLLFACCIFTMAFPAVGQNTYTIRQQNTAICKLQSYGNANAYFQCMSDREQAQKTADNQAYMAKLQKQGNGSPCWTLNSKKDEYANCTKGLGADDLKAEFDRMNSACETEYTFCGFKEIAQDEQNKRQAVIDKEKIAKREAAQKAELDRVRNQMAADAAASDALEDQKKQACGVNYHKIRVGMDFAKVKQCYGNFRLISEVARADGIVSIYIAWTGVRVYVMNGKVTAWYAS